MNQKFSTDLCANISITQISPQIHLPNDEPLNFP